MQLPLKTSVFRGNFENAMLQLAIIPRVKTRRNLEKNRKKRVFPTTHYKLHLKLFHLAGKVIDAIFIFRGDAADLLNGGVDVRHVI